MNIQSDNLDEEINLLELLQVLWEGKIIIISLTAFTFFNFFDITLC